MPGLGLESPATCGGTPLSRTAPGRRQLLVEEVFVFRAGLGLPFFAKCGCGTGDDACDFESADQGIRGRELGDPYPVISGCRHRPKPLFYSHEHFDPGNRTGTAISGTRGRPAL